MDASHSVNKSRVTWSTPLCVALGLGVLGCVCLGISAVAALPESEVNLRQATNQSLPAPSASFDITAVSALNLFGTIVQEQPVDAAALPTTTLNLALSGIIAGVHPETSRALIAEGGKPSKAYFKGDTLTDGATIRSIDSNFVIVERGNRLEKLSLYRVDQTTFAPVRHLRATTTETVSAAPPPESLPSPEAVYKSLEERIAAIRKKSGT